MHEPVNKKKKQSAGRKKRIPVLGIILTACFVIIPAVLFIIGMQGSGNQADTPQPVLPSDVLSGFPSPESAAPEIESPAEPVPTPMPPAVKVKGIYYHAEFSDRETLARFVDLVEDSQLNAIVIDLKNDYGSFTFATDNPALAKASSHFVDSVLQGQRITADEIADMKERGIYTIARVVCFKDNRFAVENPAYALSDKRGGAWRDRSNTRWLDPSNRSNWEYIAQVCREAAKIGFDEVQLDYVRYPASEGILSNINYGTAVAEYSRSQTIYDFISYIREEMIKEGIRTSADIFGITGMSGIDAGIVGQDVQLLLGSLDSICPMIYPSHFSNVNANGEGQYINGILFEHPDNEPHAVVYNALFHYKRQLEQFKENNAGKVPAVIRPYLQYFTASWLGEDYYITYGPDEVLAQIQAVYDAGFDEWIIWTVNNNPSPDAIP